ncbi:MAG: TauD/TfdA family dioxygenase [Alphaproteobacteria bacterium]|nr:TauD/TfdA family dioxygenase [Alphaproteobacteria bacterium]
MSIDVRPTGAAAGAEIFGVDLTKGLDSAGFAPIQAALDAYGVIVLRDQKITPEQQIAFSRHFGELDVNFNAKRFGVSGSPEIYIISNIVENGQPTGTRRAGETWHTDMSYAKRPARVTMLYAVEVPVLHGLALGGTGFANAAAAWDALPQSMQDEIRDLKGVFDFRGRKRSSPVSAEDIAQYPPVEHPIVRTHPRTGRKGLYIARDDCTGIVGKDEPTALALIEALADHIVRPDFVYQHRWRVGDVVAWDNCTVQHRAVQDYDLPQRRLLWRTTVKGDVPH